MILEQHNLRAAIDWATANDPELGLRLTVALENFWITNDPVEGMRRFEALLGRAGAVPIDLLARAFRDYGGTAQMSGDLDRAEQAYEESGRLFREVGDEAGVATITFRFGVSAGSRGELEESRRLYEESLDTFHRIGDPIGELQVLGNLGAIAVQQGDLERGRELLERSAELGREAKWTWWEATQFANLGEVALISGDIEEGRRYARQSLELAVQIGDREVMVYTLGAARLGCNRPWRRGGARRPSGARSKLEEATRPFPRWAQDRELYAAHAPKLASSAEAMPLEEAAAYALSLD